MSNFGTFDSLPIYMYSNSPNLVIQFDYSWFWAKDLFNFVSLLWKLHNLYCHKYLVMQEWTYYSNNMQHSCLCAAHENEYVPYFKKKILGKGNLGLPQRDNSSEGPKNSDWKQVKSREQFRVTRLFTEHEIYQTFMLQYVSFDCWKSNQYVCTKLYLVIYRQIVIIYYVDMTNKY